MVKIFLMVNFMLPMFCYHLKKKKRKLEKKKKQQNVKCKSSHLPICFCQGAAPPTMRQRPQPQPEKLSWLSPHNVLEETFWELRPWEASELPLALRGPSHHVKKSKRWRGRPHGEKGLARWQAGVGERPREENEAARSTASTQSWEWGHPEFPRIIWVVSVITMWNRDRHTSWSEWIWIHVPQSFPTLCNPIDCSLTGSSVHGSLQARYGSGLPVPSPKGLPNPEIELRPLALQADSFLSESPGNPSWASSKFLTHRMVANWWAVLSHCTVRWLVSHQ